MRALLCSTLLFFVACKKERDDILPTPDVGAADTGSDDIGPKDGGDLDSSVDAGGDAGDVGPTDGAPIDAGEDAATISTARLDFGRTVIGTYAELTFTIENRTQLPVVVMTGTISGAAGAEYTITTGPLEDFSMLPGAIVDVTVRYDASVLGAANATLPVSLCVDGCTIDVELAGTGVVEAIACTPSPLDFGVVNAGSCRTRDVDCANGSDHDAVISGWLLTPNSSPAFTVMGSTTAPATLAGGESLLLSVDYCPTAITNDSGTIAVTIEHPDPRYTTEAIPVMGSGGGANGCAVTIAPPMIDFGSVPPGSSVEAEAVVSNVGSTGCAINVVGLATASDPEFSLVAGAQSLTIAPNASAGIRVRFAPAIEGQFSGEVELTTTDPGNASPRIGLLGLGMAPFAGLRLIPTAIDFGQVQSGCTNASERTFTIQNNGAAAASVTITVASGAPAFGVTLPSPNPISIPAGGSIDAIATFLPPAIGDYTGRIMIAGPNGSLFLQVDGQGAAAAQTTVTFPGRAAPELDVLLVVDDSGSMTEEQARLGAVAPTFIARGDASGVQYHIGVTTTDPTPGISGTLRGSPNVVRWSSANRGAELQANVNVGVNGSGDERGLETMVEAVTDQQLLAGPNAGFLRPNAELVVIIISDEEDHGAPTPIGTYLNQLSNRPTGAPGTPRVYTITGGSVGCTSPQTNAEPSPRYVLTATQSGGFDRSICLDDYTPVLTEIADQTFAPLRARFPLGTTPVPGSIAVRVGGTTVPPSEYGFDFITNEVVFIAGFEPLVSETVAVDYTGLCVPSTCGDASPQAGEQCDDGNPNNADACLDTCQNAFCGDTFGFGTEQCDDGNTISGDGCNFQCGIEGCGNGVPEPPEECDDGNQNSNTAPNACRLDCIDAFCGDNVMDTGEACDDGNPINTDGCVACATAFCGDGFPRAGVEECDDGNPIDTDGCSNACTSNLINFVITSFPNTPFVPTAGTPIVLGDDTAVAQTIGFPFNYLGVAQTEVRIASNGFIAFDPMAVTTFINILLPNTAAPNAMVAWWWDDLDPSRQGFAAAPEVRTALVGTAPNRVRTITWLNIPHFGNQAGQVSAEIRLYEGTDVIELYYGALVDPAATAWSASTGWESEGGTRGADNLGCGATCAAANWPTNTRYVHTPQ
jgi:cysteine-rich repeat protein